MLVLFDQVICYVTTFIDAESSPKMSRTQGMLLSLHHDASFPLLARNLSRVIINRCNVPIINTVVKTHIRSFASTNGFQRGGSNAPLKHRADMNLSTNQAHNAKPISNPEPSARYDFK